MHCIIVYHVTTLSIAHLAELAKGIILIVPAHVIALLTRALTENASVTSHQIGLYQKY